VRATARALLRAWGETIRSFYDDEIEVKAHALTFRTLLSLVPALAVIFSLFDAFGGLKASEKALRGMIVRNLAPGAASKAMDYISTFVDNLSGGAMGGVGVVFLFLTVVSLLASIEGSMNALWGINRGRPFFQRFVVYWTMVTVGPVLLALSLTMTSALQSHALPFDVDGLLTGLSRTALALVPWVFSCAALTLLYLIVPNTNVRWRPALGGGLVAGTLWEIGKLVFTWASVNLFRYNAVYGSLGTLIVFLIWLQVGWIVILLGCKITFVLQHSRMLRDERLQVAVGPQGRELLALSTMIEAARAYRAGSRPPTLRDLIPATRATLNAEQDVLGGLVEAGLLLAVPVPPLEGEGDQGDEDGYVPGKDPSTITPADVLRAFQHRHATAADLDTGRPSSRRARTILERAEAEAAGVTGAMTLAEAAREATDKEKDDESDAP
jgi:membrane protein